jgi:hypothetical protein
MADSSLDLSINIGANTQDFASQLQKAENLLGQFQAALKKSTNVGEINYLSSQISNLNTVIDGLNTKMASVKKPSSDATNALSNLSRVAQDAPYGFMGIANNLNPLLESFQRLSKETGSAGGALKAMVSGLSGPAGIGIALGVVSSLIVAFGDDIMGLIGNTSELEKAQAELRKSFIDNLKGVEATIASDESLVAVINDVTMSTEARQAALKQLKEAHKGNVELQKTDINDGEKLIGVIDRMAQALIRKAQIEGTAKIIGEKYAELVRLQTADLEEQIGDLSGWTKAWDFAAGSIKGAFGGTGGQIAAVGINLTTDALANNANQVTKTQKVIEALKGTLADLTKVSFKAGDYNVTGTTAPKPAQVEKETADSSDLATLKKKQQLYKDDVYEFKIYADKITNEELRVALEKAKINKASANEILNIKEQAKIGLEKNAIDLGNSLDKIFKAADNQYIKDQKEQTKERLANQLQASKEALDNVRNQLDIETKLSGDDYDKKKEAIKKAMAEIKILMALSSNPKAIQDLDKAYKDMDKNYKILDIDEKQKDAKKLTQQYEKYADVIATTLTEGFMTMFDAMASGENPLEALGDYAGNLVKKLAEAAIQAAILQGVMMAFGLGGEGGFAGGFIGGFKKILGFAEGGIVSRPTVAMVGEGGQSEAIMPLNKLGNMMNSTFAAGAMSGTGGGSGQFVLKGNDLVLALQRSNYSLNLRRGNGI